MNMCICLFLNYKSIMICFVSRLNDNQYIGLGETIVLTKSIFAIPFFHQFCHGTNLILPDIIRVCEFIY